MAAAELLQLLGHPCNTRDASLPALFEAAVLATTDEGPWGDAVRSLGME